jgi:L-threonylcarbamoyladenylate synthase
MKRITVDEAVEFLKQGKLVVVPTETVYGLAADGTNELAIEHLYQLKGRPASNPVMLQVADLMMLSKIVAEIPPQASRLIEKFWPGPLTIVLPKNSAVSNILSAGTGNIGVRMPDQQVTLEIIRKFGSPLAVPSANLSGQKAPVTPQEVEMALDGASELAGEIAGMVDAGVCGIGMASTVLDLSNCCRIGREDMPLSKSWRIIREGPISAEQIAAEIGAAA